ncbi:MAG: sigma-54-dependent Fis family transcriptional regulator [Proteobacteria bacterium]|nr:sigma-54-dependent Fis family transcriptional regulator [Pseudomonadota bacterium]
MKKRGVLLLIDDDRDFASTFADRLGSLGFEVSVAGTASEALGALDEVSADCVLVDIGLPDMSGMELIGRIAERDAKLPIVMVTGTTKIDTAIEAIKKGAYDYVVKPIDFDSLLIKLGNAVESRHAFRTIAHFEQEVAKEHGFGRFVFRSELMNGTVEHLKQLAETDATVLITGESGVGKELAARTIHYNGPRRLRPFVPVSCAAVPETLIENELFGHEKGSFTDAFERQPGKFEHAAGGTIFLDEIGDLSPGIQTKLLRVLQEKKFHRIGGVNEVSVDVRVIAATNRDLDEAVRKNEFRSDLFYRLSVLPVRMPSLKERGEDIIPLARHFLGIFSRKVGKRFERFSKEAEERLAAYPWPGNVRELQNAIERAAVFGRPPEIRDDDLALGRINGIVTAPAPVEEPLPDSLDELEALHIGRTLGRFQGNISKAAAALGIGRDTLYRKIRQYGIKQNT